MKSREQALKLLKSLKQIYPDAHCALNYRTPWELLVATILSAQCTDVRVNQVTVELFTSFPDPASLALAPQEKVEAVIRSTGFFRNKAKNLISCASQVLERHQGEVPQTLEELVALGGVGRKTANVVLGNAFGVPGMVVDTHVKRLARRFGWTRFDHPDQIEKDLCRLLPASEWTQCAHLLIWHGRACCRAPVPHCSRCAIVALCPRTGVERAH
jgi:endonuclease-3